MKRKCIDHDYLLSITFRHDADFWPYGKLERENYHCSDCSCGCHYFIELRDPFSGDWGICANRKSHRCGLLTFEHQGCEKFTGGK